MGSRYTFHKSIPTPDELSYLEDRLYEYNAAQTGRQDGELFAFLVRDDQQQIVAGLSGWTWAGACEIQVLWVANALRGQGYGRELLDAAEGEARAKGCGVILIRTYGFQAPGFYQKQGYDLAWQLDDFPPGNRHCLMLKRFVPGK